LEHFWDIVLGTFSIFSKPYFHMKSRFCDFFGVVKKFPTMTTPVRDQNQRGGHGGHGGHKKKGKMIIQILFLKNKKMTTMTTRPIPVDFVQEVGWAWIETF